MMRLLLATALTGLAMLSIGACGDGFDTEEANAACNEEKARLADSFDDGSFAQCVSCHEECGDSCATIDTVTPATFTCPSDDE